MDARKSSTKTRSFGNTSQPSRTPASSRTTSPSGRPQFKERVRSAPLVTQTISQSQRQRRSQPSGKSRRESQTSESSAGTASSPPASPADQHASRISRDGSSSEVQEVSLAVLGASAVGKSTFVRCALDLKKPVTSPLASKKVSLEGRISIVRLLEIGIEKVEISAEQDIRWPEEIEDERFPHVDGVLVIYNVMDKNSITRLPNLLKALSTSSMPTVLVSAKCDHQYRDWEVDQEKVEAFCNSLKVDMFGTSITSPETHKRCISVILRKIIDRRIDSLLHERPQRPRALTSSDSASVQSPTNPQLQQRKHARAASEVPTSVVRSVGTIIPSPQISEPGTKWTDSSLRRYKFGAVEENIEEDQIASGKSRLLLEDSDEDAAENTQKAGSKHQKHPEESISPQTIHAGGILNSAYDSTDPTEDTDENENANPISPSIVSVGEFSQATRPKDCEPGQGKTFDELVDQLVSRPMSKPDSKFVTIFLCLYRKFAAPFSLLSAIISRFENLDLQKLPSLARISAQLRFLNILKDWISDYPGDFAHETTRNTIRNFLQGLKEAQEYALACQEIWPYIDTPSEDDDAEWACSDRSRSRSRADTTDSYLTMSSVRSAASTLNAESETLTADSSTEDIIHDTGPEQLKKETTGSSNTVSTTSSTNKPESQSASSFQTLLTSVGDAKRQAQQLRPVPRNPLTKVQWHQFMEIPDEQIARELTRIDWIMYCSIRPRDLIRHVSLSPDKKERSQSLEHVNLMVNHFNLVAFWVANVILLREKPKHRAKALEKFMGVAWQLRYLNNYNSLGAIIAGINGTAVHRLSQTRELIPAHAQKQFMRLEILMGTQKSHFAYRLAYENTTTQRIPFLPLHRRDLVLAEQGNRTFVDSDNERINWAKFEVMGEVIISINKSQRVAYPKINPNEDVFRLVLEGRFCKDDERLYERSIQLEAPGAGEIQKKKFNWFQR